MTNSALDAKTRELVAGEITDAPSVAITVNAGGALVYSARTLAAFNAGDVEKSDAHRGAYIGVRSRHSM